MKTLSELSPPESKTLYEKMANFLRKRDLIEPLTLSLVNSDRERRGFMAQQDIVEVVRNKGMKISTKQGKLLTQVLVMNHKHEHCYLEMVALLTDEQFMLKVVRDNNIDFGDSGKPKKIDMSLLKISEALKDQLELKYV